MLLSITFLSASSGFPEKESCAGWDIFEHKASILIIQCELVLLLPLVPDNWVGGVSSDHSEEEGNWCRGDF